VHNNNNNNAILISETFLSDDAPDL